MKKLITFILLLSAIQAFSQTAPVAPIQLPTNSAYYEPSTHRRWFYNGATYLWWQAVSKGQLDSAVTALSTTANNGLTKTGNNIALGGTLLGTTTIAQAGNPLAFTNGATHQLTILPGNRFFNERYYSSGSDEKHLGMFTIGADTVGIGAFFTGTFSESLILGVGTFSGQSALDPSARRLVINKLTPNFSIQTQTIVPGNIFEIVPQVSRTSSTGNTGTQTVFALNPHIKRGGTDTTVVFGRNIVFDTVYHAPVVLDQVSLAGNSKYKLLDNGIAQFYNHVIGVTESTSDSSKYFATTEYVKKNLTSVVSGGYVPYTGATSNLIMGAHSVSAQQYYATGTSGVGFLDLPVQSVSPVSSTSHLRIYADSLDRLSWKNSIYRRTIRSARARDQTFTMPNRNDPIIADSTDVATVYALKTTTVTGANGNVGGGDLSNNKTISNENDIRYYGGNLNGIADNTAALAAAKAALGTKKPINFPQNSTGTAKYYFNGQPDFTGYTFSADRDVVISDSTSNFTTFSTANWLTPIKIYIRDRNDTAKVKPNIHLPEYTSAIGGLDKTMGFTNLARVINSALTKSYYNSTSDTRTAGVGTNAADNWRVQISSGTIASSAAPDSLTFDVMEQPARLGKIYTSSVTSTTSLTNGAAVATVFAGTEWIVFGVESDHYTFGSKKNSVAFADTVFKKTTVGHQYYFSSLDFPAISVRIVGLNKVEFYVNGYLIKKYTLAGNAQTVGFGVNRSANTSGTQNIQGNMNADMQRRNTGSPLNVFVFGDSISLPEGGSLSWVDYMKKFMTMNNGPSLTITNIAVSGEKLAQQWARMKSLNFSGYDYVAGVIGTNDRNTTLSTFKLTADSLAAYVATFPGVKLIMNDFPMATDTAQTHAGFPATLTGQAAQYRTLLQTTAIDYKTTTIWAEPTSFLGATYQLLQLRDNLHPQTLYEAAIAEADVIAILNDQQGYTPNFPTSYRQGTQTIAQGTAIPTTGQWLQGDIVFNTTPASGSPFAWTCSVAGAPGTWIASYATTSVTGTGSTVMSTSATLVTPALGTPSALVLTNATGLATAGLVNNAVTYAKMQTMTTNRLLGSGTGTAVAEMSVTNGLDIIPTWGVSSLILTADTATASTGLVSKSRLATNLTGYLKSTGGTLTNANFGGTWSLGGVALSANQIVAANGSGTGLVAVTPALLAQNNIFTAATQKITGSNAQWVMDRTTLGGGNNNFLLSTGGVTKWTFGGNSTANENFIFTNAVTGNNPLTIASADDKVSVSGALLVGTKINITAGSNASVGTATLVGGTVTVSTTAVTSSSKIFLTDATTGALTNIGTPTVGTIVNGTSFVINSSNVLDTSNINWIIIN